jgi:hypothetical protein
MIKKLRNQPHAPMWEQVPKMGAKRKKKIYINPNKPEKERLMKGERFGYITICLY